jgi:hypothetical protein
LKKKLLILAILVISTVGLAAAAEPNDNMGNKYLVSDFQITAYQTGPDTFTGSFTATITNQQDNAVGDLYYEIKTNPAANHQDVLQSGTLPAVTLPGGGHGTFGISDSITTLKPVDGTTYYILVYTHYPEHDNRVSKETGPCTVTPYIQPT